VPLLGIPRRSAGYPPDMAIALPMIEEILEDRMKFVPSASVQSNDQSR
jgi:hypothetical protein